MNANRARLQTIALVDHRVNELKERLRMSHELGCQLVAEIVRLERERARYVLQGQGPAPALVLLALVS